MGRLLETMFLVLIVVALAASAFVSFRFTKLDPQMPIPRHIWWDMVDAAIVSILLVMTMLPVAQQWKELFAYAAITMVAGPAIIPPYRLTKTEEPRLIFRYLRSIAATIATAPVKIIGLLVVGAIAAFVIKLFPEPKPPEWFVLLGAAGLISIITRPLSFRIATGETTPIDEADETFALALRKTRASGAVAFLAWLCLAMPLLEDSYSDTFSIMSFVIAVFLAILLS